MGIRTTRRRLVGALTLAAGAGRFAPGHAGASQADVAADQSLRYVSPVLPRGIGPNTSHGALRPMQQNVFRTPFVLDRVGEMMPGVCTDWSVNADGLVYTLTVDPQARFSDGSAVTAADLKFSWEYLAYPETQSWAASYLAGPILGYQDVVSGETTEMAGLVAVGDQTLEITLSQPHTPFLASLTTHIAGVVQRANVLDGGPTWDDNPVCCGPYQVESWDRDTGAISWAPNEHWWGETPIIQRVTHQSVADPNTRAIMWDNDEVELFEPQGPVLVQMQRGPAADLIHEVPYGGLYFFHFKANRPPVDDVNVRRALLKATDMGTIVQAIFQGGFDPAYGVYARNLPGYQEHGSYFDPDGARAALAASAYGGPDGLPPIAIAVGPPAEYVRVAEAMGQMWQDILGVQVGVELVNETTDPAYETAHLFRHSHGTLILDPAASVWELGLSTSYYMNEVVEGGSQELDDLILRANALPVSEQEERIALYQQGEEIILDQAYYIPINWLDSYHAVKPWVRNYATNIDFLLYTIPEMYIAEH